MKHKTICFFSLLLFALSGVYAQNLKLKVANNEYRNMRYSDAIMHYEQLTEEHKDTREVKFKLADCYRRVKDAPNAMRMYAQLAHEDEASPQAYWYYAQFLAQNGYYAEAAGWYEKYMVAVPDDQYARKFVKAYAHMEDFYADSSKYYVQYVPSLNSWTSDFSPMYYKNGLVFLSNRDRQEIVRRVFETDQSAFLSYYMAPDTAAIEDDLTKPLARYVVDRKHDHHADHNIFTSNDTHLPAEYGHAYKFDSVRYHQSSKTQVIPLEKVSHHRYHEGPLTFTKTQDTVYFTRSTPYSKADGQQKTSSRFSIFMSRMVNGDWTEPQVVPGINSKNYSTGHPALNADNTRMYFASNRPGGMGGVDLYRVDFDHGVFAEPVNLTDINTAGDEMFPFVDAEGTLYFSTDTRPGLGGLDIFRVKMDGDRVISIANAGAPFNSPQDDFGIIWNHDVSKGYFSSTRKRGLTDDDIYAFKKLCRDVTIFVYDSLTQRPLDSAYVETDDFQGHTDDLGQLRVCMKPGEYAFQADKMNYEHGNLVSRRNRVEIAMRPLRFDISGVITSKENDAPLQGVRVILTNIAARTSTEIVTGKDGKYNFPLASSRNYTVTISKNRCGTQSLKKSTVGLKQSRSLRGDMEMLCQGDIIRVDNIYYDFNKYNIRPDAAEELDKLAVLLNQYPDMRIELRSHTDSRGSDKFNMKLSANRAQAVLDYLANHGVVSSRMRAHGYGETIPLNKCTNGVKCSDDEFQQNRRTEFKVLSID